MAKHIGLTVFGGSAESIKLLIKSFSLRPPNSYLLGSDISLSALFTNILSIGSFLGVSGQVLQSYRTHKNYV
jgi:hypothetical protein